MSRERCQFVALSGFRETLDAGLEDLGHVPQLGKAIHGGRREGLAIGRKRHAANAVSDVERASKQLAGLRVPHFQRVVLIASDDQLIREISARAPGSAARLRLVRDGHDQTVTVKLAERPARDRQDTGDPAPQTPERGKSGPDTLVLGLNVRDLDRQTAERLEVPRGIKGVLITRVEPMSSSFDGGIERGTVLIEINRQRVESVAEYRRIARAVRPGDILTLFLYTPDLDQRQLKTIRVEGR